MKIEEISLNLKNGPTRLGLQVFLGDKGKDGQVRRTKK